ncbi:MAG: DEAD/DEAH box helicase [Thermocladium sp.]
MVHIQRRLDLARFLREDPFIRSMQDKGLQVLFVTEEKGDDEQLMDLNSVELDQRIRNALAGLGIKGLYRHQVEAIVRIINGENAIIVSPTGTGKTEAFIIPLIHRSLRNGERHILIYPTKALARDQGRRLDPLLMAMGARAAVYDGDSPSEERAAVYGGTAPLILTNPDMINVAMQHVAEFRAALSQVKYVVLDEFHIYNGVLGTHMYYLIRRMKRINPGLKFIAATATIGNPLEHFTRMIGEPAALIQGPQRRRGMVRHVLIKPIGVSRLQAATRVTERCLEAGMSCIMFADSHRLVELAKLILDKGKWGSQVRVHRAGLSVEERHEAEDGFKAGKIRALLATPTLELGIDVGSIDVVVLATTPPSFSKYMQRSGRAGRMGQLSYVIQVLGDDPMSTYYARHPAEFYGRSPEPMYSEPNNGDIASLHLLAASMESDLTLGDLNEFELSVVDELIGRGLVTVRSGRVIPTPLGRQLLRRFVTIRGSGDVVKIRSGNHTLGYRELPMALRELHRGAIYLHGGRAYEVLDLRLDLRLAIVKPTNAGFTTKPLYTTFPRVVRIIEETKLMETPVHYAELEITETVVGFVKKGLGRNMVLGEEAIEPMSYGFRTKGLVLYLPQHQFSNFEAKNMLESAKAYHAVEHVLISAGELVVNAAPTDMGGVSLPTGHVVIYDAHPGGSGVTRLLMDRLGDALRIAGEIVSSCSCEDGCPKCIYSPYCGNNNRFLSRHNAIKIIDLVKRGTPSTVTPLPNVDTYA